MFSQPIPPCQIFLWADSHHIGIMKEASLGSEALSPTLTPDTRFILPPMRCVMLPAVVYPQPHSHLFNLQYYTGITKHLFFLSIYRHLQPMPFAPSLAWFAPLTSLIGLGKLGSKHFIHKHFGKGLFRGFHVPSAPLAPSPQTHLHITIPFYYQCR